MGNRKYGKRVVITDPKQIVDPVSAKIAELQSQMRQLQLRIRALEHERHGEPAARQRPDAIEYQI